MDAPLHQLAVYPPSPILKDIVQRYEFHSVSEEHPLEREVATLPCFDTGFIFSFFRYEPFLLKHAKLDGTKMPETSILPPVSIHGYNYGARGLEAIRVVFYPGVIAMLYNAYMGQYENIFADVSELLDRELNFLHEHLAGLVGHALRIKAIEQFLLQKLGSLSSKKGAVSVGSSLFKPLSDLFETRGYSDCAPKIASEFGWVARNFNRHLNKEIGFSFDTFRRIHRFISLTRYLQRFPDTKLVELAHQYDFSDQPHFNKEFRHMSGLSPSQYIQAVKQQRIVQSHRENKFKYGGILVGDS